MLRVRGDKYNLPSIIKVINCKETGGLLLFFTNIRNNNDEIDRDRDDALSMDDALNIMWVDGIETASTAAIEVVNSIQKSPNLISENLFVQDDSHQLIWTRYSSGLLKSNSCIETPEQLVRGVTTQDERQNKCSIICDKTRETLLEDKWVYWSFPVICRFLLTYQSSATVLNAQNECFVHNTLCKSIPLQVNERNCIGDLILTVIGGWNVGDGIKFGVDRLLYRIGATVEHAPYMALYEWEDSDSNMTELRLWGLSRLASGVKKDLLLIRLSSELRTEYSKRCITAFFNWIIERINSPSIYTDEGHIEIRSTVLPLCPVLWSETKLSGG